MTEKEWIDYGKKHLLGKQIVSIRYLTEKEKTTRIHFVRTAGTVKGYLCACMSAILFCECL